MAGSLKEAFFASPGPRTWREAGVLWLKGMCMGGADIIPGVSGGTMALITGIYTQLIEAIRSVNGRVLADLFRLRLGPALEQSHVRFLLVLGAGVLTAIVSMARVIHYFMDHHPVELWALFFGLIAASIIIVARRISRPETAGSWALTAATAAACAAAAYFFVGLIPVQTPDAHWFIFLCGMVAICAMILPGVSGAFLLLILGKYATVTGALKNPFLPANMMLIVVFAAGCAVGVAGFSRVLHWLLAHYRRATMAGLTGLMVGAMRKVWPWKEVLEERVIRGKTYVLRTENVLPDGFGPDVLLALGLMAVGFAFVLVLDKLTDDD